MGSLVTLVVVGCATDRLAWRDRLVAWGDKTVTSDSETLPGRIEQVRQLQGHADSMNESEQDAVVRSLMGALADNPEPALKSQVIETLGYYPSSRSVAGFLARYSSNSASRYP